MQDVKINVAKTLNILFYKPEGMLYTMRYLLWDNRSPFFVLAGDKLCERSKLWQKERFESMKCAFDEAKIDWRETLYIDHINKYGSMEDSIKHAVAMTGTENALIIYLDGKPFDRNADEPEKPLIKYFPINIKLDSSIYSFVGSVSFDLGFNLYPTYTLHGPVEAFDNEEYNKFTQLWKKYITQPETIDFSNTSLGKYLVLRRVYI